MQYFEKVSAAFALMVIASCSRATEHSGQCGDTVCDPGQLCSASRCYTPCLSSRECPTGSSCAVDGLCGVTVPESNEPNNGASANDDTTDVGAGSGGATGDGGGNTNCDSTNPAMCDQTPSPDVDLPETTPDPNPDHCMLDEDCTVGCTEVISDVSVADFTFSQPAKLCITATGVWGGSASFDSGGTLEVCGQASPRELTHDGPFTLRNHGAAQWVSDNVDLEDTTLQNEGTMRFHYYLTVQSTAVVDNRGRLEAQDNMTVQNGGLLVVRDGGILVVTKSLANYGQIQGSGAASGQACGRIEVGDDAKALPDTPTGLVDICPSPGGDTWTLENSDVAPCSCLATPKCE